MSLSQSDKNENKDKITLTTASILPQNNIIKISEEIRKLVKQ